MTYKEVLEVIKKNKPCKVRFTGSILAIVYEEFNVDIRQRCLTDWCIKH